MLLKDAFVLDAGGDGRNIVLSYGPCQFPTLGFVVERFWEIQAHEPEEFWTINCSHTSDEGTCTFNWLRGHLFDYSCSVIIYEMCVEAPTATVTKVRHMEKRKYPPVPLNTVELQKRASRYFRISSEHAMKVAEDLYQWGFISYPRTETDSFPQNTDLHVLVQEQQGHPEWGLYAQRLLDAEAGLWSNPGNGGHDDKAHPPIHPTRFSTGETRWNHDHRRLYELVVRHFLACVSKPAIGAETIVEVDIAGESFTATGRMILEKNYLDVYRFESWGGSIIPKYTINQQFVPTVLTLNCGVTRPPPLLSESDLLGCMDKAGIGTDATMHDHIQKLLDRSYATKDQQTRFSPTNLGEALVMGYDNMGYELWKPYLRAAMESDMKAISARLKRKADVLACCLEQMKACFLDARQNKTKLLEAMEIYFQRTNRSSEGELVENVRMCNICQESNMVLRRKPDGYFMVGCLHFPLCRNVVWLPGPILSANVTREVCSHCLPGCYFSMFLLHLSLYVLRFAYPDFVGPVYKIQFKFHRSEIPPNYNAEHLGCIGGCDETLKELIEYCGTGSRIHSSTPARAWQPRDSVQAGSGRQSGTCSWCHQSGHSSNNCPEVRGSRNVNSGQNVGHGDGRATSVCTLCGAPCILRTANTAANRGRKFYRCQSPVCDYFAWVDDIDNDNHLRATGGPQLNFSRRRGGQGRGIALNSSGGEGRGRGRRRGRSSAPASAFVTATGEPLAGGRCYSCGDPSHFANTCPNR